MQIPYRVIFFISISFLIACQETPVKTTHQNSEINAAEDISVVEKLIANSKGLLTYGNDAPEDTSNNCTSSVHYVGQIVAPEVGLKYHLVAYEYEFGLNCTHKLRLLVFDEQSHLLGYYSDLEAFPMQIEQSALLFRYKDGEEVYDGDFYNGIPKTLLTSTFESVESL